MYKIARLNSKDRKLIFDRYKEIFQESSTIVEKDFWVSLMLDYLFNRCEYKDYFIFKGGTSLSKCYHTIDRFSEDIDLILDWSILGVKDDEAYMQRSKSSQIKYNKRIQLLSSTFIKNKLLNCLIKDFASIIEEKPRFEIDDDGCSINFYYPKIYYENSINLLQCIKLEIGPLAEKIPITNKCISPLIAKLNLDYIEYDKFNVKTISLMRSFWEKIIILYKEAHRPINSKMPLRYSRHYYDVFCIWKTHKKIILESAELLNQVVAFNTKFYYCGWADYENAKIGTIKLMPNNYFISALKQDYEKMKNMIYGETPSFEQILKGIKQLEIEINNI